MYYYFTFNLYLYQCSAYNCEEKYEYKPVYLSVKLVNQWVWVWMWVPIHSQEWNTSKCTNVPRWEYQYRYLCKYVITVRRYYSMIQWFNFMLDEQGLQNTNNNGPLTWLLEAKLRCNEYEQSIIVGTMVIMINFNSRDEAIPPPPSITYSST